MYSSVCKAGPCFGFSFGWCTAHCIAPGTWTSLGRSAGMKKWQTPGHTGRRSRLGGLDLWGRRCNILETQSWTESWGYCIQLSCRRRQGFTHRETRRWRFAVCSWIEDSGLANLSGRRLCGGAACRPLLSQSEKPLVVIFWAHYQHLHSDPWEDFATSLSLILGDLPFSHLSEAVGSLVWSCPRNSVHSLRASHRVPTLPAVMHTPFLAIMHFSASFLHLHALWTHASFHKPFLPIPELPLTPIPHPVSGHIDSHLWTMVQVSLPLITTV